MSAAPRSKHKQRPKQLARRANGSPNGPERREMILDAAAELFARQGFHATGIDDIGETVGVTGPAIYRHFEGKHDLLTEVLRRYIDRYLRMVEEARERTSDPEAALRLLIRWSVEASIKDRDLAAVYLHELHNLPREEAKPLIDAQRQLIDEWADVLREVRPQLSKDEASIAIQAMGGLVNSITNYRTRLSSKRLQDLLFEMAMGALLAVNAD